MRILQVLTQARGGPVDHAADVAVELARLGHDSQVVGPPGAYGDRLRAAGVALHHASVGTKHDVVGAVALARLVDRVDPDVVHLQDRRAGMFGRLLGSLTRRPTVYTLHGVPDPLAALVPGNGRIAEPTRRDRIGNLTGERLLARAPRSRVVVPCEALARYARDHVGIPAARIRTVYNGVGDAWLAGARGSDALLAGGPGGASASAATRAVWVGVMQPVKRVPDLVAAAAEVPGMHLTLVGDGPQRPHIEAAVARTGSHGAVTFTGFRADPRPLIAAGDLLVLPSAAEACPMAVLQAMACGRPVVATRVGGVAEIVRDGIDGLLVPAGDVAALRDALRRLSGDPDLRRRMGEQARERVRARFTAGRCAQELVEVYQEVAA